MRSPRWSPARRSRWTPSPRSTRKPRAPAAGWAVRRSAPRPACPLPEEAWLASRAKPLLRSRCAEAWVTATGRSCRSRCFRRLGLGSARLGSGSGWAGWDSSSRSSRFSGSPTSSRGSSRPPPTKTETTTRAALLPGLKRPRERRAEGATSDERDERRARRDLGSGPSRRSRESSFVVKFKKTHAHIFYPPPNRI